MNVHKRIAFLDNAILNINGFSSYNIEQLHKNRNVYIGQIKGQARACLRKIGANSEIVDRVSSISFSRNPGYSMGANHRDYQQIIETDFRNGVNSIVQILFEYRDMLERTKNAKIQFWTLVFSAIAAITTIIALVITVFS